VSSKPPTAAEPEFGPEARLLLGLLLALLGALAAAILTTILAALGNPLSNSYSLVTISAMVAALVGIVVPQFVFFVFEVLLSVAAGFLTGAGMWGGADTPDEHFTRHTPPWLRSCFYLGIAGAVVLVFLIWVK
jgi:ABC-type dipeptide/oligopeptide/nickel transport system permease component